jgi:hypothetical protein
MKLIFTIFALLLLSTLLFACSTPTSQPVEATATATITSGGIKETPLPTATNTPAPTNTTLPAEIPSDEASKLEVLKNYSYWVQDFNIQVALSNGTFDNGEIRSQLIEPAAFGDLNGDGTTDAALILTIDPSGSGTFYYLTTVINLETSPVQAGTAYIGDRQGIKALHIVRGQINLDYITQGPNDPLCCASEQRIRSYILEDARLKLTSEQIIGSPTSQATPLPVAILIDQPSMGSPLTNPLTVIGRISQVPAGKSLTYRVTDSSGNLLDQGEVPVKGEPGATGNYAFDLTLEITSPGLIQLELVDSVNGILLGRSIVVLITP